MIFNTNFSKTIFTFLLIVASYMNVRAQWTQMGETIQGQNFDEHIGKSVSVSGDGLRMASIGYDFIDAESKVWHLEIYDRTGDSWTPVNHQLTLPEAWNYIEVKLSSDGSTLVISTPNTGYPVSIPGFVQVYMYEEGNWIQKGNVIISDSEESKITGHVAINSNGSKLAVGSLEPNLAGVVYGRVTVYQFEDDNWVQQPSTIETDSFDEFNWNFDFDMSGDGSTIGVKAASDGEYLIYMYNSENWISKGSAIVLPHFYNHLDHNITFNNDGSIVAVSDPSVPNNDFNFFAGLTRLYEFSEMEWSQMGEDIYGGEDDLLGSSVSMTTDGLKIAIGAPRNLPFLGSNIGDGGYVRVLEYDGNSWNQIGEDIGSDGPNTRNGYSVSFNDDGSTLVIGSPGHDNSMDNIASIKTFTYQQPVSISESILGKNISMNPNPTTDQVFLDFGDEKVSSITVMNNLGQEVLMLNEISHNRYELSLAGFSNGLYFVKVTSGDLSKILKLVKE